MASYYFTDHLKPNWKNINWANIPSFKYRFSSAAGHPLAQPEFDRRNASRKPTAMWRFDDNHSPPTLVAKCHL